MKISHAWLEEFLTLDPEVWTPQRIATVLTDLGLEVDHVYDPNTTYHRIVIGIVTECARHPKADKLSVCAVDVGESETRTIVCGAPNVQAGQSVVVALDGAVIPNGAFEISKRILRGVESNGMICSASELNLGDDAGGIMVLRGPNVNVDVPDNATLEPGTPLPQSLRMSVVYDVAITPNRADCLSHIGIARELYAYGVVHGFPIEQRSLLTTYEYQPTSTDSESFCNVRVQDAELAPLYAIQRIRGVTIRQSPDWLQSRLRDVGLRPRNIVVDVTNYVNMELGQPLHAFDSSKLRDDSGQGGKETPCIVVRKAGITQSFTTLDGKVRNLDPDMLMICDAIGPIAIAGVMGGSNSDVDSDTSDVCIESAWFQPRSIRRTAKALGLSTDASYRFERGVDHDGVLRALQRATQLICSLAGGEACAPVIVDQRKRNIQTIVCRFQVLRDINGITTSNEAIATILTSLGFDVTSVTDTQCHVTPPSWRVDIESEIDCAEEIMRMVGVNNIPEATHAPVLLIPSSLPPTVQTAYGWDGRRKRNELRLLLRARGYSEAMNMVLTSPDHTRFQKPDCVEQGIIHQPVVVRNPLGVEYSHLRTSLLPGLLTNVAFNRNHGAPTVRLMEFGSVFSISSSQATGVEQTESLALVICGSDEEHWSRSDRALDLYDVMGDLQLVLGLESHNTQSPFHVKNNEDEGILSKNAAILSAQGRIVGFVGQIVPEIAAEFGIEQPVFAAEVNLDSAVGHCLQASVYQPVSQFPQVRRDVAFIVDEKISAGEIISVVDQVAGDLYFGASVFDVFVDKERFGSGKKSVGIAIRLGRHDRTLVESEVDQVISSVISTVRDRLGATVRG